MTERVIYKYQMTAPTMEIPAGIIRHVAAQFPEDVLPTIWVEHDRVPRLDPKGATTEVVIVGTGHVFEFDGEFIGTVLCAHGRLVWHCWQRPEEVP